jgi:cystathionine beta-synthase
VRQAFTISDAEAFATAGELLRAEGILAGSSSGTLIAAALRYCRAQAEPKRVVTFVCDGGDKYLSKMYNEYWMIDQGFIERESHGDLRDLISRRHVEHEDITVTRDDTLLTAYSRMKLCEVSQLPVVDDGHVIGIVDESDILLAVYDHEDRFADPVHESMTTRLETVAPSAPLSALLPILDKGHAALVRDGDEYLGLITRIDLLNHLRRRMR